MATAVHAWIPAGTVGELDVLRGNAGCAQYGTVIQQQTFDDGPGSPSTGKEMETKVSFNLKSG